MTDSEALKEGDDFGAWKDLYNDTGGGSRVKLAIVESTSPSDEWLSESDSSTVGAWVLPFRRQIKSQGLFSLVHEQMHAILTDIAQSELDRYGDFTQWLTVTDSSRTYEKPTYLDLYIKLEDLFQKHANDEFEPGYISEFETTLEAQFYADPYPVTKYIGGLLSASVRFDSVLAEALRVLGQIKTDVAAEERFRVLCLALRDSSPHIRDYAAVALSDLGDKRAIKLLQGAAERETIDVIRNSLLQTVEDLETA